MGISALIASIAAATTTTAAAGGTTAAAVVPSTLAATAATVGATAAAVGATAQLGVGIASGVQGAQAAKKTAKAEDIAEARRQSQQDRLRKAQAGALGGGGTLAGSTAGRTLLGS